MFHPFQPQFFIMHRVLLEAEHRLHIGAEQFDFRLDHRQRSRRDLGIGDADFAHRIARTDPLEARHSELSQRAGFGTAHGRLHGFHFAVNGGAGHVLFPNDHGQSQAGDEYHHRHHFDAELAPAMRRRARDFGQ